MDIDGIRELIIGFVLVSLIAGAGALALVGLQTDVRTSDITTVNETIAISSLRGVLGQGNLLISATACYNASLRPIPLGVLCNVSSVGIVTFSDLNFSGSSEANITYSYYTPNAQMNITNSGLRGIDNTTSYFGTAGTIAGVALLMVIVLGAFYFVTRRSKL